MPGLTAAAAVGALSLGLAAPASAADCPPKPIKPTLAGNYPAGCYVYEKISPADKGSGEVQGGGLVPGVRAARDGNTFLYGSDGTFAGSASNVQASPYAAARAGDSWSNHALSALLPHVLLSDSWFTPDPDVAAFQPGGVVPTAIADDGEHVVQGTNMDPATGAVVPAQYYRLNVRTGEADRVIPPRTDGNPAPTQLDGTTETRGTADYSAIAFSASAGLTADTASDGLSPDTYRLYLWRDGDLRHIGRAPATNDPVTGKLAHGGNPYAINDVSADGKVVFWSPRVWPHLQAVLYRYDASADASVDVAMSENPDLPEPVGNRGARMLGATADGRDVFFTAERPLADGMGAPVAGQQNYLFRYRHSANPGTDKNLTLITPPLAGEPGLPRVSLEKSRMSRDGSTLYIHAHGRLTSDTPSLGAGELAIYRWREEQLQYVTKANLPNDVVNQVSDDGRYYVIDTTSQLTATPTNGTLQRYRYDAATDEIVCVSCNPDGPTDTSVSTVAFFNTMPMSVVENRYLANDGSVVVETPARLLPQDKNDARDIYLYSRDGLQLISTGEAPTDEVRFSEISVDARSIFFVTREQLSAWDTDNKKDAYVARLDGGLPEPDVRPDATCQGDACQPRTVAPLPPPFTSLTFAGSGNVDPGPAPLGDAKTQKPKTVRGTRGSIRVSVPAKGSVRVSGNGLRRATRSASKARTLSLPVRLTARATRTLNRKGRFSTRVTVRYSPVEGKSQRLRVSVTFKKAKKKSGSRSTQRVTKAGGR